jgi:rhodanese-related sulfurtransferase
MTSAAFKNDAIVANNAADGPTPDAAEILDGARARQSADSGYAGGVTPAEAWQLFSNGHALLIDVRSAEERKFVGHIPNTLHVAWATGASLTRNPRFTRELESNFKKDQIILFLCRSGKRSAEAARAATKAGFIHAFNVLEGFEGDIDANGQRGCLGGWRSHRLPWIQD